MSISPSSPPRLRKSLRIQSGDLSSPTPRKLSLPDRGFLRKKHILVFRKLPKNATIKGFVNAIGKCFGVDDEIKNWALTKELSVDDKHPGKKKLEVRVTGLLFRRFGEFYRQNRVIKYGVSKIQLVSTAFFFVCFIFCVSFSFFHLSFSFLFSFRFLCYFGFK